MLTCGGGGAEELGGPGEGAEGEHVFLQGVIGKLSEGGLQRSETSEHSCRRLKLELDRLGLGFRDLNPRSPCAQNGVQRNVLQTVSDPNKC